MYIKTYGIKGLSEWHGAVKAGSISVNVSFTGGTVSPSGAQPAYFVTKDPVTQFVIENSKEFKDGFIHLEMSVAKPGEHPRMAMPKATGAVVDDHAGNESKQPTEPTGDEEPLSPTVSPTETATKQQEGPMETATDQKVVVADKSEAVEWLKEHYPEEGYTAVKLRTMAAVNEAGKKHGVVFEIAAE